MNDGRRRPENTASRLRFKTKTKTQKTYLLIGILLEKPRIKVGSMQRKLQKVREKFAIAVLKGKTLIKKLSKEDKNYA